MVARKRMALLGYRSPARSTAGRRQLKEGGGNLTAGRRSRLCGSAFLTAAILCLAISCWPAGAQLEGIPDVAGLPILRPGKIGQVSSAEKAEEGADFIVIKPGETQTIAKLDGPAVIERIWLTAKCRDDLFRRNVLIRAYWDGETNPSIDSPLGDFFGVGFGLYKQYTSLLMGMTSDAYYCYFPMPFRQSARFEIVNQSKDPIMKFYFQITYRVLDSLPEDAGYFHAKWRREEKTKRGEEYLILDARGEGKFVGCVLSLQGMPKVEPKFMEGDDKFYIDGSKEPSLRGTGVEDYFNSGWYFSTGEFAADFHGCTVLDKQANRISAYRFHILDPIPFERSLRMTMGHGESNDWDADFSSVAYWYQKEPHFDYSPMPAAEARAPMQVAAPLTPLPPGQQPATTPPSPTGKPSARLPETAAPGGPVFAGAYYKAGELALPFLALMVALVGLGYLLRRVLRARPTD